MGRLKTLFRILAGRPPGVAAGRAKPGPPGAAGSNRWSTYLTETVRYHH